MYISNETFRSRGGTLFLKGQKINNMRYFILHKEDKLKFTKEKDARTPSSNPTSRSYSSDYSDSGSSVYAFPVYDTPTPLGGSGWESPSSSDSSPSSHDLGGGDSGDAGASGSWDSGGYSDSGSCDSGGGDCGGGDCGGGGGD